MTSMVMVTGIADVLAADHQNTMLKNAERARLLASLRGPRLAGMRAVTGGALIRIGSRVAGRVPTAALSGQPARA